MYLDRAYYDLWAVGDKDFNSPALFHLKEDAEELMELLEKF